MLCINTALFRTLVSSVLYPLRSLKTCIRCQVTVMPKAPSSKEEKRQQQELASLPHPLIALRSSMGTPKRNRRIPTDPSLFYHNSSAVAGDVEGPSHLEPPSLCPSTPPPRKPASSSSISQPYLSPERPTSPMKRPAPSPFLPPRARVAALYPSLSRSSTRLPTSSLDKIPRALSRETAAYIVHQETLHHRESRPQRIAPDGYSNLAFEPINLGKTPYGCSVYDPSAVRESRLGIPGRFHRQIMIAFKWPGYDVYGIGPSTMKITWGIASSGQEVRLKILNGILTLFLEFQDIVQKNNYKIHADHKRIDVAHMDKRDLRAYRLDYRYNNLYQVVLAVDSYI
ncbi:hypothetical protein DFH11DRAFT_863527 [Phellopilus nigrolimitatus]|nr:hypothetical protein DFH11DRAFT_863527 [Phellopilus nigrolimitatus]